MDTNYIAVYVIVLLVTIFFPLYLAGRVWFAFSPFIINYYSSEQKNWYNDWNTNRFVIVFSLFAISLLFSIFWGTSILEKIQVEQIDIITILFYTLLHIICFVLLEGKMDILLSHFLPIEDFVKRSLVNVLFSPSNWDLKKQSFPIQKK